MARTKRNKSCGSDFQQLKACETRIDIFPSLSPDRAARAYTETLRLVHAGWEPAPGSPRARALGDLYESAARICSRQIGSMLTVAQTAELEFRWTTGDGLEVEWTPAWRAELAYPSMSCLKYRQALSPYECGLIYLLLDQLARRKHPASLLREVRQLERSWHFAADGGRGFLSRLLIRIAVHQSAWSQPLQARTGQRIRAITYGVLGALCGAAKGMQSNNSCSGAEPDWNRLALGCVVEALKLTLPLLPGMHLRLGLRGEAASVPQKADTQLIQAQPSLQSCAEFNPTVSVLAAETSTDLAGEEQVPGRSEIKPASKIAARRSRRRSARQNRRERNS